MLYSYISKLAIHSYFNIVIDMVLSLTILSFPVLHVFVFPIYAADLGMKCAFLLGHITCFGKCTVWVDGSDQDINNSVYRLWYEKAVILFILTVRNFLSVFLLPFFLP